MQSQISRKLARSKVFAGNARCLSKSASTTSKFPRTNLYRMVKFGAILLMAVIPGPSFCVESRPNNVPSSNKGNNDDNKPSFQEWFSNLSNNQNGDEFFKKIQTMIAENPNVEAPVDAAKKFFESGMAGKVGYGFVMGYSSGFCLKKVSKAFSFVLGGAFILIQSLSYSGYIKVDYDGIKRDVEKVLDVNQDGKVDEKDIKHAYDKVSDVLGYQMPAGGGFAAGLLMGLRA